MWVWSFGVWSWDFGIIIWGLELDFGEGFNIGVWGLRLGVGDVVGRGFGFGVGLKITGWELVELGIVVETCVVWLLDLGFGVEGWGWALGLKFWDCSLRFGHWRLLDYCYILQCTWLCSQV